MAFPPEAYIIGAMKAGTTSLADWLDQHPMITLSVPKEPAFFTRNWERGLDWYKARFHGPLESLFLDATPAYTGAPTERYPLEASAAASRFEGVPERIKSVNPNAKFIYVLRDPANRTYSDYWHRVRQREETRSFHNAITGDMRYFRASDYHGQLMNYLEHFPLSSFLLLIFEDMVKDPQRAVRTCLEFLRVPPGQQGLNLEPEQKNKSFQYNRLGKMVAGMFPSNRALNGFLNGVKAVVPKPLRPLATRVITSGIPPMSEGDRRYLIDCFREPNAELAELTGLSLDGWQT